MGLTPQDLQELLGAFEASTWQEMSVSVAGDKLHVSRREGPAGLAPPPPPTAAVAAAAPAPPAAPSPAESPSTAGSPQSAGSSPPAAAPQPGGGNRDRQDAAAGADAASGVPVPAPSVGLFWRAPSPGAPPFVDVGTRVGPDDVIGIVEVMKLMNRVQAGVSGVVRAVLVDNGGMVEHGQPLILVDPSS